MAQYFDWDDEKNKKLKEGIRGISFEEIIIALEGEKLLDIIESPTHPGQECYVVELSEYAYIVPYTEEGEKIFLKTIYPSRKFTKFYLNK